jgi:phosphatidylserine decarboxylase
VGLIKFGSRTDVIFPAQAELKIKVGDRVKGGASVLAQVVGPRPTNKPAQQYSEVVQ